ncbi:MAG: hypothetical protein MZV70_68180 [Desulfobacterales bacterium]|nr:hypothetical protein [Desulfobacterales bacterium]
MRNLMRRKGKAAFILAGLVIGVATVVGIISFVEATHPRHRPQARAVRGQHPDRAPHRKPLAELRRALPGRGVLRPRGNPGIRAGPARHHPQPPQHRGGRPDGARGGVGRGPADPRWRGSTSRPPAS